MSQFAHRSIINYSPRSALAVANGVTQDDPAIVIAQPALVRQVAHP
jgi:hypothetical protein